MKTYRYELESVIAAIDEVNAIRSGHKLPDGKIVHSYHDPVWAIKLGPPLSLTFTISNKPPFSENARATVILEIDIDE